MTSSVKGTVSTARFRRRATACLFIAVLLLPAHRADAAGKKLNVVDYYNLLNPGAIQFAQGWMVKSVVDEYLPVTVDLKNGYISWSDPGTGGGTLTMEIALFIGGGRTVLAVSRKDFDGVGMSAEIRFYNHKKGAMEEITSGILPPLSKEMFLVKNYDRKAFKDYATLMENGVIVYKLPRYGITMEAGVDFTQIMTRIEHGDVMTEPEKKKAKDFFKNNFVDKIELVWNVKSGRFTLKK